MSNKKATLQTILTPHMVKMYYLAGNVITEDVRQGRQLLLIVSGAVLVEYSSTVLAERKIGLLLSQGKFIGLEYLFPSTKEVQSQVTALQDTQILSIPLAKLKTLMAPGGIFKDEDALDMVGPLMAESLCLLQHRIESLAIHSHYPKESIMSSLTYAAKKIGIQGKGGMTVPIKADILAKLTGLSPDSIRRCITLLVQEEAIALIGKGNFLIFNP